MTQDEVSQWFRDQGVGDIAGDEARYVYGKYGPGGESDPTAPGNAEEAAREGWQTIEQVLAASLPSYMQRHLSGGSGPGSYNTNLNDPEITLGGYTAPARFDSNPYGLFPDIGAMYPGGVSRPGGGGGGASAPRTDWSRVPPTGGGSFPPVAPGQPGYPGPWPGPQPPTAPPEDWQGDGPGPGRPVRRPSTDPTMAALQTLLDAYARHQGGPIDPSGLEGLIAPLADRFR